MVSPAMQVYTEVGVLTVTVLEPGNFVLSLDPWHGNAVTIDWLERRDIEGLAQACTFLLNAIDAMGGEHE